MKPRLFVIRQLDSRGLLRLADQIHAHNLRAFWGPLYPLRVWLARLVALLFRVFRRRGPATRRGQ